MANDIDTKREFFMTVMEAIVDAGYPDPGFYVDEYYGDPYIFDKHGEPLQSIACDSPIAIICDFAKMLERIDY